MDASARYVKTEAPRKHQAFGADSVYDAQRAEFVAVLPYSDLRTALLEYRDAHPDEAGDVFPPDPNDCSWADVSSQIDAVKTAYDSRGAGVLGFVRWSWRGIGGNKDLIDPFLGLIPESNGLGVLKAGLSFLLFLAARSAKNHQTILNAVTEVMDLAAKAQEKRRHLPRDRETASCAHLLYTKILAAVVNLVRYMADKGKFSKEVWKHPVAYFKNKTTADDIEADLKLVRLAAATMIDTYQDGQHRKTQAEVARLDLPLQQTRLTAVNNGVAIAGVDAKVAEARAGVDRIHQDLDLVATTGQGTYATVSRIDGEVAGLGDAVDRSSRDAQATTAEWGERLQDRVNTLEQRLVDEIRKNREQRNITEAEHILVHFDSVHLGVYAQNGLTAILRDEEKKRVVVLPIGAEPGADYPRPLTPEFLTPEFLSARASPIPPAGLLPQMPPYPPPRALVDMPLMLRILGVPVRWESPTRDLEMVLRRRDEFHVTAQAAAQYLVQTPQFRGWLTTRSAGILLADGNDSRYALHDLSPMSVVSAMLVASIARPGGHEQGFVARFFCGLHCKPPQVFRGPGGMLRALLAEMVLELDRLGLLSLAFADDPRLRVDLAAQQLPALCHALRCLAAQFPPAATVYCVVDGIGCFETAYAGNAALLGQVMHGLASVVEQVRADKTGPDFKVLVTAAGGSRVAREFADEYVILGQHISNAAPGSSAAVQAALDQERDRLGVRR